MNRPAVLLKEAASLEEQFQSSRPWRTIARVYGRDRKALLQVFVLFFLKHSPAWALPVITANVVDIISRPEAHSIHEFWINAAVGTALVIQNPLSTLWFNGTVSRIVRGSEARLRVAICRRLQQLNISFYKHRSSAALQMKALRDVESMDQIARILSDSAINAVVSICIALTVTAIRAPSFLPAFLLLIPPVVLMRILLTKRIRKANKEFRLEVENLSSKISTMIEMIPVSRAHVVEEVELSRVATGVSTVQKRGMEVDSTNALFMSASWSLLTLLNMVGLMAAAWCSYHQYLPLSPGDVVMIGAYFGTITHAILNLNNMLPQFTRGFEAVRSIGEVLECPDIEQNHGKLQVPSVGGNFAFQKVSYQYDSTSQPAITHVDLEVRSGETIAFVGPSGSGKSTLVGLILGFLRPTSGRILLDGREMNEIDLRSYRRWLSVVSQETLLFQGTLRDNVIYGTENVTEERLQTALRDANVLEFVAALPDGMNTMIGEKGARLSGGQRQRIAIARAIIRNPRVLILDEATSALDVESEFLVQQALERLVEGRTTFIVAHRLSTIRNASRIVVLEHGKIVEMGTLEELLACKGKFSKMHSLQAAGKT
jgi:ATP-binding cassette, subfamily B, bacterial